MADRMRCRSLFFSWILEEASYPFLSPPPPSVGFVFIQFFQVSIGKLLTMAVQQLSSLIGLDGRWG
jgi:hypothetical protein